MTAAFKLLGGDLNVGFGSSPGSEMLMNEQQFHVRVSPRIRRFSAPRCRLFLRRSTTVLLLAPAERHYLTDSLSMNSASANRTFGDPLIKVGKYRNAKAT